MNDRIKQLAEQSGFHFYDLHDVDGEDLGETVEADSWSAVDKFAELIIKESCDLLHNNNRAYTESVTMLKKYFGIE